MKLTTKDNKRYQMVPVPPGLLQYYVKKETIVNLNIDKTNNTSYKEGYELECHTIRFIGFFHIFQYCLLREKLS